jgi:hypothetical protein
VSKFLSNAMRYAGKKKGLTGDALEKFVRDNTDQKSEKSEPTAVDAARALVTGKE